MKIFLDTASVKEIKEGVALGVVDGVTTNPSLIAKEKRPFRPLVEEICSIVPGDVSLEVVATDFEGMVKEGEELAQVAPNAVVKCPLTKDGLKAVKYLSGKGIRVNQTLCFSATQALLSAKAGAVYISPFLGRLDDISHVGMDLVRDICEIYRVQGFKTQVLAASIRNPLHVIDAAKAGAHVVTIPFAVLEQLMKHPLTDIGLKKFLEDWAKLGEKIYLLELPRWRGWATLRPSPVRCTSSTAGASSSISCPRTDVSSASRAGRNSHRTRSVSRRSTASRASRIRMTCPSSTRSRREADSTERSPTRSASTRIPASEPS